MDLKYDPGLVLYLPFYELDDASLVSKEKHGHLATVTGAIWTPQGRWFDGIDDQITATNPLFTGIKDVSVKTVGMWVYTPGTADYGNIYAVRNVAQGQNWQFYRDINTLDLRIHHNDGFNQDTGWNYPLGGWACIFAIIDGQVNEWQVFADGNWVYTAAGQNFAAVSGGGVLTVGHDNDSAGGTGTFGEVWMYNRRLTPLEIQHAYLVTKWRYQ